MIPNYDDLARLEYGRLFWKNPRLRAALIRHWTDPRHPYRERFSEHRSQIEEVLSESDDAKLERKLRRSGASLRAVMREIPPVFGAFWNISGSQTVS
ncbi:MAG: hypothetical protein HY360_19610 [Verrucomicrobia bacterium]|nr:hypothetical protein [Verrucomicrobiota bacterium]